MPLFCFARFRSSSRQDSSSVLDCPSSPRSPAEQPPLLSEATTNLFDTFPRIVFGGYRRYYECNRLKQPCKVAASSLLFNPSLSPVAEDAWSWQHLPKFTGKKPKRQPGPGPGTRKTNSSLRNNPNPKLRLRKKPRFHPSAKPLVDLSYPWPDWLRASSDSESDSDSGSGSASKVSEAQWEAVGARGQGPCPTELTSLGSTIAFTISTTRN
ncbi:hypothetical protein GGX14DRAFT_562125 [Mycena pura]|uniref:Uncharacterized protein n=1 Tax=Mycena pura TaxID=153505 RepID=A0AAD6VLN9_9AGAR|nr:hypothetical protein GGX14DRAFT_562125 [Mycena pura]